MNRYFSRLAQRSGVNANAPVARLGNSPSNTESSWGEHSVETIATADATTPTHRNENIAVTNASQDNTSTIDGNPERIISSAPVIATSIEANDSGRIQHKVDNGFIGNPTDLSTPLDTTSHFLQPRQSIETETHDTELSQKASATERAIAGTKTLSETTSVDWSHSKKNLVKPSIKASTISTVSADIEAVSAFSEASIDTGVRTSYAKPQAARFESQHPRHDNETVESLPARSEATALRHASASAGKIEAVKSGPVQTSSLPIQKMRAMTNPSIEVNIGKIELEIITPTKKTASTPKVAPAMAQGSKPAAVFNPHRHYLRGR